MPMCKQSIVATHVRRLPELIEDTTPSPVAWLGTHKLDDTWHLKHADDRACKCATPLLSSSSNGQAPSPNHGC